MVIGSLVEKNTQGYVRFERNITANGIDKPLWISVERSSEQFFCKDRVDGFVVGLLLTAMAQGEDIYSSEPVSETLLFNLEKYLIPYLVKINPELHSISIRCKIIPDNVNSKQLVGTGISCGVDSLSTIVYHSKQTNYPSLNINCLTLFNSGYYGNGEKSSQSYKEYITQSIRFCEEQKYHLLAVDSNISDFAAFPFLSTHTYLTSAIVLMLQNGFSTYYYSSGYSVIGFQSAFCDSAYYDVFLLQCISTKSLHIYSSCTCKTRVEKVDLILKYPDVAKHLFVCTAGNPRSNCSRCEKCIRTLLEADSLGKVDDLYETFDVDFFSKRRSLYMAFMLRKKRRNVFYKEIYESYRVHSIKIPLSAYIHYIIPTEIDIRNMRQHIVNLLPESVLLIVRRMIRHA